MFDLLTKLLVLAVIALVVFGPNELPKIASQAGRVLRDLRRIAEGAKADLREGLGPEFQDFDFEDLNPRRSCRSTCFDEDERRRCSTSSRSPRTPSTGRHRRGGQQRQRRAGTAQRPGCRTAKSRPSTSRPPDGRRRIRAA